MIADIFLCVIIVVDRSAHFIHFHEDGHQWSYICAAERRANISKRSMASGRLGRSQN
jgi:hypothetical protein